jgi:hypothetical protein
MPKPTPDKIEVRNVNHPDQVTRVDAAKYHAMKTALTTALAGKPEGLSQSEMIAAAKPHLPEDLFPGGATAGWWVKCVQLDLEAKGEMKRAGKPLRFSLA